MSTPVDVLAVLDATATGLWSVANNCTRSDLATTMRDRAQEFDDARAAVAELIEADIEFDAAKAALAAAKREKGNWRVNPLGHNHPAVIRSREAGVRRAAALDRVRGEA